MLAAHSVLSMVVRDVLRVRLHTNPFQRSLGGIDGEDDADRVFLWVSSRGQQFWTFPLLQKVLWGWLMEIFIPVKTGAHMTYVYNAGFSRKSQQLGVEHFCS